MGGIMSKYQSLIDALTGVSGQLGQPSLHSGHVIYAETEEWCSVDINVKLSANKHISGPLARFIKEAANPATIRALLADLEMAEKALAALAQQAQEPVAAALGDIVALWDKYAPSEYMTAIHMQAKRALAGQQPVSPDMHRWCAYVGGMVASWVTSEPDAHARLGDDKFEVAIAGIIERRLWAMPKRDTTPPAPQPAPVDERAAEIAELRAEALAWRKQCDRLTHQVICCGVAASHPDATLTTRGAYAGKWNSGQAEEVRKLRAERDALAALSQPAPSPQPAVPVVSHEQIRKTVESIQDPDTVHAFHNGYYTLTPDELRRAILALRPAVEPMTPFTPAQRMRLWQNTEKGKSATSLGAFERICQTVEAAHRIGITAKAEVTHQPTKEAEKP